MAKNQEDRKDKDRRTIENYCYYEGAIYSPGAYVKVDGLDNKLLYCNLDGTWELKDPPQ
jgi:hypothetical protein